MKYALLLLTSVCCALYDQVASRQDLSRGNEISSYPLVSPFDEKSLVCRWHNKHSVFQALFSSFRVRKTVLGRTRTHLRRLAASTTPLLVASQETQISTSVTMWQKSFVPNVIRNPDPGLVFSSCRIRNLVWVMMSYCDDCVQDSSKILHETTEHVRLLVSTKRDLFLFKIWGVQQFIHHPKEKSPFWMILLVWPCFLLWSLFRRLRSRLGGLSLEAKMHVIICIGLYCVLLLYSLMYMCT